MQLIFLVLKVLLVVAAFALAGPAVGVGVLVVAVMSGGEK